MRLLYRACAHAFVHRIRGPHVGTADTLQPYIFTSAGQSESSRLTRGICQGFSGHTESRAFLFG